MDEGNVLFIVQCDSGHNNGDLIACAKYRLEDVIHEESKIDMFQHSTTHHGLEEPLPQRKAKTPKGLFHVLFTVYLPRKYGDTKSSFVGFLGGDWKCTHIDDFFPLHPFSPISALACGAVQKTLSEVFHMIYIEPQSCGTPGARAATAQQIQFDSSKGQTYHKLYVHIQKAVEKSGHLPTGITAERMKKVNETLLKLLGNNANDG